MAELKEYLNERGLREVWDIINGQNSLIVSKIKDIQKRTTVGLYADSTSGWEESESKISEAGALYIYTDAETFNGKVIAKVKIGDGTSSLADLSFIDAPYSAHIADRDIHFTAEERAQWNNEISAFVTAAEESANTAGEAANRAETAKTAAETARDTAVSAKERAKAAEANASQFEYRAEKYANDAKGSEQNAAKSAERAEGAEHGAISNANKAGDYATKSGDSAHNAGLAANRVQDLVGDAARQADRATVAANRSETAAQTAQTLAEQVTADKTTVADHAAQVATDRKAAETAAQTAQSIADSLPDDYVTAVGKIAENTAEIANVKLTDKELKRRVDALFDMGQGVTHRFETDSSTAYAKTVPTGAKLMSVKSIGGHSEVIDGEIVSAGVTEVVEQGKNLLNADDYYAAYKQPDGSYVNDSVGFANINIPIGNYIGKTLVATLKATVSSAPTSFFWAARINGVKIESSYEKGERVLANTTGIAKLTFTPKTQNDTLAMSFGQGRGDVPVRDIQVELGDTPTAYTPYHRNTYQIPEAIKALPGYGVEGNAVDYEAKTYTQNNAIDGTEIKALDTPIITDISTLIDDDFLRNLTVEAGGSVTFKNSNGDSYRIPVPSEEEYIVKLSEVGGTT